MEKAIIRQAWVQPEMVEVDLECPYCGEYNYYYALYAGSIHKDWTSCMCEREFIIKIDDKEIEKH